MKVAFGGVLVFKGHRLFGLGQQLDFISGPHHTNTSRVTRWFLSLGDRKAERFLRSI